MTFILEWVHSISIIISLYLVTWTCSSWSSHSGMSSFWFSVRVKFLFWYEVSFWYCVNWNQTLFQIENHKLCSLVQVAHVYLIWHENHIHENALGLASQFYHVMNAVQTSFWKETRISRIFSFRYHVNSPLHVTSYFWFNRNVRSCFWWISGTHWKKGCTEGFWRVPSPVG